MSDICLSVALGCNVCSQGVQVYTVYSLLKYLFVTEYKLLVFE